MHATANPALSEKGLAIVRIVDPHKSPDLPTRPFVTGYTFGHFCFRSFHFRWLAEIVQLSREVCLHSSTSSHIGDFLLSQEMGMEQTLPLTCHKFDRRSSELGLGKPSVVEAKMPPANAFLERNLI